jgi:hypothetical protein
VNFSAIQAHAALFETERFHDVVELLVIVHDLGAKIAEE